MKNTLKINLTGIEENYKFSNRVKLLRPGERVCYMSKNRITWDYINSINVVIFETDWAGNEDSPYDMEIEYVLFDGAKRKPTEIFSSVDALLEKLRAGIDDKT